MGRGLGNVQNAILQVAEAHPHGLVADAIARQVFGRTPSTAQLESVRRAIRTLSARGLVDCTTRWDKRPRKSLKRLVNLAPCQGGYCDSCAQRKRRVRLQDWHRRAIRANAKHDPGWLKDLAAAEQSGFIHATASAERVIDTKPNTVDACHRRVQFISPKPNR